MKTSLYTFSWTQKIGKKQNGVNILIITREKREEIDRGWVIFNVNPSKFFLAKRKVKFCVSVDLEKEIKED